MSSLDEVAAGGTIRSAARLHLTRLLARCGEYLTSTPDTRLVEPMAERPRAPSEGPFSRFSLPNTHGYNANPVETAYLGRERVVRGC
jgi:hypothetical protein